MIVKCIVRVRVSNQLALRVRRAATKFATRRRLVSNTAPPPPPVFPCSFKHGWNMAAWQKCYHVILLKLVTFVEVDSL